MYFIKSLIPDVLIQWLRPYYHGFLAWFASKYFGNPSQKLVVIGVTGTNGKSTTVNLLARILEEAGKKVGYTSTVTLKIGEKEILNPKKMTMPSGWLLQKWMKRMVDEKCEYAIIEVSSEGLAQNRHIGICFDVAVLTNLTPEHIESHGGFENYKHAKGKLFETLSDSELCPPKAQINPELKKTIVTNSDDEHSAYFAGFKADRYITYGVNHSADYQVSDITYSPAGIFYKLQAISYQLALKGQFDVYNSLAAIATARGLGIGLEVCKTALEKVLVVPGRVEVIQTEPFMVVVDYAYEPEEMRQLYETIARWPHKRVIQVLGPTGGGRDTARIPQLGRMAAEYAEIVFVTTDDPYDEDPKELIHKMADGAVAAGKVIGQSLFRNPDRRGAITKALFLAAPGDIVLVTGKGADQSMALAHGKYMPWDDRKVVREELGYLALERKKEQTAQII